MAGIELALNMPPLVSSAACLGLFMTAMDFLGVSPATICGDDEEGSPGALVLGDGDAGSGDSAFSASSLMVATNMSSACSSVLITAKPSVTCASQN
jgi:hypothetical protein